MRPGSIETDHQELFLKSYNQLLWKRAQSPVDPPASPNLSAAQPRAAPKSPTPSGRAAKKAAAENEAERKKAVKNAPRLIVLAGLPGSGKSTFAKLLESLNREPAINGGSTWVRVNQDELGHRSACEALVTRHLRQPQCRFVIDRCNVEPQDRASWAQLCHFPAKQCTLVYFDYSRDACVARIMGRADHPTITANVPKKTAQSIVDSFVKKLVIPQRNTEVPNTFGQIMIIRDEDSMKMLLLQYGVSEAIVDAEFARLSGAEVEEKEEKKPERKEEKKPERKEEKKVERKEEKKPERKEEKKEEKKAAPAPAVSAPAFKPFAADNHAKKKGHSKGGHVNKAAASQEQDEEGDEHSRFFKFPRTHHLFDTGGTAVSRDDLLVDEGEHHFYYGPNARTVLVQEKVDGANLGLSLTRDYQVLAQNRSHYVNSQSHSQFGNLDTWIDQHRQELCTILEPERHILFGEWCRAKHSIFYQRLPDYFLAFDIWDAQEQQFLSFSELSQRLSETTICTVPLITEQTFSSKEEILALLDTESAVGADTRFVEGVYLRIDQPNGQYLERRCKVVRSDFIQGITEHWTKQGLIRNIVLH
eukprot:TRINITY_DN2924_c0_g1_i4.p1 TRINITY_DN2924_c0_g1~~TRINITY_DN2924_c0_g1_i4.p1  ORF type:complete len:588 (+),score=127.82 TRINITY_DN2924_c0_g1_i4:865-2628(+)